MAITSVWFVSGPRLMRTDVTPDGQRWYGPVPVAEAIPALAAIGVGPQETAVRAHDAFAMTATTAVVSGILLDLARGGAAAGRPFWGALNGSPFGISMTGFGVPGKALVETSDQREILDAVQDELTPAGAALTFAAEQGGAPVDLSGPAAMLSDGLLIAFQGADSLGAGAGFRQFDTDRMVADEPVIPIAQAFPPLAEAGVDHAAAAVNGLDALALAMICDLESGLRPDAFHPLGRYGLLQLDVSALNLAGWRDDPAALLIAPPAAQTPLIAGHLAGLNVAAAKDPGPLWASILTMRDPLRSLTPETVVAARTGPRADLYATHAAVDADGRGAVTVGDLDAFLRARFDERRAKELEQRLRALRH
jgi:hypothetical protein